MQLSKWSVCLCLQKPALRGEFSVLKLKQSRLSRVSEPETFPERYPPPPPHSEDLQDSDSDNGATGKSTHTTTKGPQIVILSNTCYIHFREIICLLFLCCIVGLSIMQILFLEHKFYCTHLYAALKIKHRFLGVFIIIMHNIFQPGIVYPLQKWFSLMMQCMKNEKIVQWH